MITARTLRAYSSQLSLITAGRASKLRVADLYRLVTSIQSMSLLVHTGDCFRSFNTYGASGTTVRIIREIHEAEATEAFINGLDGTPISSADGKSLRRQVRDFIDHADIQSQ